MKTKNIILTCMLILALTFIVSAQVATCVPRFQNVMITLPNDGAYGISENIGNISIQVISASTTLTSTKVDIVPQIYKQGINNTPIKTLSKITTGSDGKAMLDFKTNFPTTGKYYIYLKITDTAANITVYEQKNFSVMNNLKLLLNCPVKTLYVGDNVECTMTVKECTGTSGLSASCKERTTDLEFDVNVKDADGKDIPAPISGLALSFKPTSPTSVTISAKVSSTKDDLLPSQQETTLQIQDSTTQTILKIAGLPYEDARNDVNTGIQTISISSKDGSSAAPVAKISGVITTPSGQDVDITFTKKSDGTYEGSYNFEQPGNTYKFKSTTEFTDGREPLVNSFDFVTLKAGTEDNNAWIAYAAIGGSVVILTIIGIAIYFGTKKKRR